MPAEAYLGRVGGLAVALSLGAAILTGWNSSVAWADESAGTAESTSSSAESTAEPVAADPVASEKPAKPDDIAKTDDDERSAPPGVVVSTGGLTQDDEEPTTETPPSETVAPSPPDANDDVPRRRTQAERIRPGFGQAHQSGIPATGIHGRCDSRSTRE